MEARWGATSPRIEQLALGSGVVFVVLAAIAFFVAAQPDEDSTSEEIVAHFRDNDVAFHWQALLFGLAALAFLWFAGTLAAAVRRAEADPAGRIPAIIAVSAATTAAIYVVGVAAWNALAESAAQGESSRALFDLGNEAFALSNFTAAALAGAISLGILRTRLTPDWLGWIGGALVLLLVVNGCIQVFGEGGEIIMGTITFLAFLAWVLLLSGWLAWKRTPATTERPAARRAM